MKARLDLDAQLKQLVEHLEDCWLQGFAFLLMAEPAWPNDSLLQVMGPKFESWMDDHDLRSPMTDDKRVILQVLQICYCMDSLACTHIHSPSCGIIPGNYESPFGGHPRPAALDNQLRLQVGCIVDGMQCCS